MRANEEIRALEKTLEKLRSEPPDSNLVSVLNKLAYALMHTDPRKAEDFALEAMDLAQKQGLHIEHAKACTTLGTTNYEVGNFAEAMSYCRMAMDIYDELGDKSGMAKVHTTIALTYRSQGIIDSALEHHHESLRIKQEYGAVKDELANSHFNIGACYSSLLRLDQAQSFYEEALKIWEKSDNLMQLSYLYNNLGCLYGRKEELDKAREYFQKALEIRIDFGDKKGIASTLGNMGSLYKDYGDNASALDFFIRSLELFEELGNGRGISLTSSCVGGIYTAQGRLDEAEELISKGLEISRELTFKDREIHCLESIIDLYKAKGDLEKALMYSRELKTCVEKHLNEMSMEKIAGLQVQFETEKKEKEAEIYRLKNVELSRINNELRNAIADMKKLQGMLPICSNCKKIRDDDGYWQQIELYISDNSEAKFSHGICPECAIKLYGTDIIGDQPSS